MSRITPGTMIVAIFAVLFGLVGAYAVRRHLAKEPVAKSNDVTRVPMASIDLPAGRPLTLSDVALVPMTAKQVTDAKLPPQYMTLPQQIIGRVLREPVAKGAAFSPAQFYPEGMGPTISERLKPGFRAVTITVEGTGIIDGLAVSGAVTDVLFRTTKNDAEDIPEATVTLLEHVEILAVGQNATPGKKNAGTPSTVTLAVSPTQANALKIAEGRGLFSLALRTADDTATAAIGEGPTTLDGLLSIDSSEFTTDIFRKGNRQSMTFENNRIVKQEVFSLPVSGVRVEPTASVPSPAFARPAGTEIAPRQ